MTSTQMHWSDELRQEKSLTSDITDKILDEHGDRGRRAIDAVSEDRVKEYLDFVVVVGKHDEYIVEDTSCTCDDYRYNLDEDEKCWHILAAEIAGATDQVDRHDMWYSEVRDLI